MSKLSRRELLQDSVVALAIGAAPAEARAADAQPFVAAPYVQLGDAPHLSSHERLDILWHTADTEAEWAVEYRPAPGAAWRASDRPAFRRIAVSNVEPHRVYSATLRGIRPGALVDYRVMRNGKQVFEAQAKSRKPRHEPYRFVVFGDCGSGSIGEKRVAYYTHQSNPDFVVIPGDIVYGAGLIREYRTRYFPVYNAEEASAGIGAPLARSTPFVGLLGNHDIAGLMLARTPDGLAYYHYFSQPLNGPELTAGGKHATPLMGSDELKKAFRSAAGPNYPRIANFSFDYGNSHWTAIDANEYVDWDDPNLRQWLEADLKSAAHATWKFVTFHQPGMSSSHTHFTTQHMRKLGPIFERHGVDVVWAGHVHNYERSVPLRFKPAEPAPKYGPTPGEFTLDRHYDGVTHTKADGVMYIVTGGGGASLYDPQQETQPSTWQAFTTKFFSTMHSLTVADVEGGRLTVRQIAEDGRQVDRWVLTKKA
jgi:3',5'-cyclic AMP phosphodiesterase CpdA